MDSEREKTVLYILLDAQLTRLAVTLRQLPETLYASPFSHVQHSSDLQNLLQAYYTTHLYFHLNFLMTRYKG